MFSRHRQDGSRLRGPSVQSVAFRFFLRRGIRPRETAESRNFCGNLYQGGCLGKRDFQPAHAPTGIGGASSRGAYPMPRGASTCFGKRKAGGKASQWKSIRNTFISAGKIWRKRDPRRSEERRVG